MKLNLKKALSGLSLAVLLLISSSNVFAADAVASITSVTGYATVTDAEGNVKRLAEGDELEVGDILNTGANSSASITLANGEVVELGATDTYSVTAPDNNNNNSGTFAQRSFNPGSPTLSTATSAGGGVSAPTTPTPGGSPTN